MSEVEKVNFEEIFKYWMQDLALINSFLKTRLGDDFSDQFFEFLIQFHKKELVRRNPKLSIEEFAEVYSNLMSSFQQTHIAITENSTEEFKFFVFDCLPYKVMNSSRPSIMPSDFPCKIWCQKFVPNLAKIYGLTGTMVKKSDGCYCTITKVHSDRVEEQK